MMYIAVSTSLLGMPLLTAMALRVASALIEMEPVYLVLFSVGVLPSVV